MIDRLGPGARLWGAVSHLKGGMVAHLADAARRGVRVALVVHDTQRRVPQAAVDRLAAAGVSIHRYRVAGLPMHAKFFVAAQDGRSESWFGSLNYNRNSRWLNDEVLVRSGDPALATALVSRFATIAAAR
jgi:phosphatidylserine/phosphatidylglycerophosphate/cardiolipin synthase-like enzyme